MVDFLCQKFSSLIDQVRLGEGREATARHRESALRLRLEQARESKHLNTEGLRTALQSVQLEGEGLKQRLSEVRAGARFVETELQKAKDEALALQTQCDALSSRLREEERSTQDAADRVARSDEAWISCERDRARLSGEVQARTAQLAAMEEELAAGKEREKHRKADLKVLQERAAEASRLRQLTEKRAAAQHEDVCGAMKQVALYKERIESARQSQQRREEELKGVTDELVSLRVTAKKREHEASQTTANLQRLRELKASLEAAMVQNAEFRGSLQVLEARRRVQRDTLAALLARSKERQSRGECVEAAIKATEADAEKWQQRLKASSTILDQLRSTRESLEAEGRSSCATGATLQGELKRLFSEKEDLQAQHDQAAAVASELKRKLSAVEPAFEIARTRVLELRASIEDRVEELSRARAHKDSLVKEVGLCRDKMRVLRRRHEGLREKAQSLEKRLLRSSSSFGGTAAFAAASALVGDQPSLVLPIRYSTPTVSPSSRGLVASLDDEKLSYLRQWVETEEARLGGVRTPPMPSPIPSLSRPGTEPITLNGLPFPSGPGPMREGLASLDVPISPLPDHKAPLLPEQPLRGPETLAIEAVGSCSASPASARSLKT